VLTYVVEMERCRNLIPHQNGGNNGLMLIKDSKQSVSILDDTICVTSTLALKILK